MKTVAIWATMALTSTPRTKPINAHANFKDSDKALQESKQFFGRDRNLKLNLSNPLKSRFHGPREETP